MALVRYNPWHEMNSLQRQLNHLFDDALTPGNWGDFGNLAKVLGTLNSPKLMMQFISN